MISQCEGKGRCPWVHIDQQYIKGSHSHSLFDHRAITGDHEREMIDNRFWINFAEIGSSFKFVFSSRWPQNSAQRMEVGDKEEKDHLISSERR